MYLQFPVSGSALNDKKTCTKKTVLFTVQLYGFCVFARKREKNSKPKKKKKN